MIAQMSCIECGTKILEITYTSNCGYCGICFNQILYDDALKHTVLSENEAIRLAEQFLQEQRKGIKGKKAISAVYHPKWVQKWVDGGGKWVVSFPITMLDSVQMDPGFFFVDVDDRTQEIHLPPVL